MNYTESLRSYSTHTRDKLALHEAPVVSYFGLHLLLSTYGADLPKSAWAEVSGELEGDVSELQNAARELVQNLAGLTSAGFHGSRVPVRTALGAWSRGLGPVPMSTDFKPCPSKAELDNWAAEHTDGMIKSFPLDPDGVESLILLASAVLLKTGWSGDKLTLMDEKTIRALRPQLAVSGTMETSKGIVALAAPRDEHGATILSVAGGEELSPADLWRATDEVVERLMAGESPVQPTHEGHSWSVERCRTIEPDGVDFTALLPKWKASHTADLREAPGVQAFGSGMEVELDCVQSAVADYNEEGFSAAAVTALIMCGANLATPRERDGIRIRYDFTRRPHALTAFVGTGGALAHAVPGLSGIRLFDCWVKP